MGFADLHIHTTWSDGLLNPRMLLNYLAGLNHIYQDKYGRNYLDVIAIADHDEIGGGFEAMEFSQQFDIGIDVMVAQEVSTSDGHVVGLNITEKIEPGQTAQATIDAIHRQGGLAIAAHPYTPTYLFCYLPFMKQLRGVGDLVKTLDFDAIETVNANITEAVISNNKAKRVNRKYCKLPELGGSDAHFISAFQKAYTEFPGHTKDDVLKAIAQNTTIAHGTQWTLTDLMRYVGEKIHMTKICRDQQTTPHSL